MKNRIKEHVQVKASELVPHELNPRTHSQAQKTALQKLYDEIGFARSLLAYRLPDGRLKLIDGHLRQSMSGDQLVDVEVLDVTDNEARALLLAIDPLAQLAGYDQDVLSKLREITEKDSAAVKSLWQAIAEAEQATKEALKPKPNQQPIEEQFIVIVVCRNETHQVETLRRFKQEGLTCTAKIA